MRWKCSLNCNQPVTLLGAYELLSNKGKLDEELANLADLYLQTPRRRVLHDHFINRFLSQPGEQLGGVRETIGNYLQYFLTPEVAEVFLRRKKARLIFQRLMKAKSFSSPCRRNSRPNAGM